MFMFLWKPILRMRAKDVDFGSNSLELSEETERQYIEIKGHYKRLKKSLMHCGNDEESAPIILKEFLSFYLKSETIVLALFNEIFKRNFYDSINKRKSVFVLLNKIMKIFLSIDCIRLRYPDVFCYYSFYKMHNGDKLDKICSECEDKRLSILGLITLPMGRLVLSLFSSEKFELFYPTTLSKRMRINLDGERKKSLYLYARLMELHNLKYLYVYFGAIYKRFYGTGSYTFDKHIDPVFEEYLDMLQNHE